MTATIPNLARRPFLNTRPVIRVALLLGAVGLVLATANLFSYWSFSQGQDVKQDRLDATRAAVEQERARIQELQTRRAKIDLESQNDQVYFLNHKIEQRTFGWSLLFDTLTEILPRDVRIGRLSLESIQSKEETRRRSARRAAESADGLRVGEILLGIEGEARNYDAFLDFLDALIASPAFRRANPSGDTTIASGISRFRLQVVYLPEQAAKLGKGVTGAPSDDGDSPKNEVTGATAEDGAGESESSAGVEASSETVAESSAARGGVEALRLASKTPREDAP